MGVVVQRSNDVDLVTDFQKHGYGKRLMMGVDRVLEQAPQSLEVIYLVILTKIVMNLRYLVENVSRTCVRLRFLVADFIRSVASIH